MIYYISGPITGHENTAEKRFKECADWIRNFDPTAKVIDPWDFMEPIRSEGIELTHEQYMTLCLPLVRICDAIYLMEGWEKSKGCQEERTWAMNCGLDVFEEGNNQCDTDCHIREAKTA